MEQDIFSKSQSWKKVRQTRNQDVAHPQKRVTVPLIFFHCECSDDFLFLDANAGWYVLK